MIRSVLAVLAGIAALTVTSFAIEAAADPLLMRMFPDALPTREAISQNMWSSLFMYTYTALCVAFGGYITALIAKRAPVRDAFLMGIVQVALTVVAMFSLREQAPLRNWIVALVTTVPCAWGGGVIRWRHS
jgi:predicted membrane-bound spermidine synthase